MQSRSADDLKTLVLSSTLAAALFLPGVASATLGEPEASVQTDAARMKGSITATDRTSYRVHEIQTPAGTALREFVAPNGNVFAVAWTGRVMPNLRQALGQFFDPYVSAAKSHRTDRNHVRVQLKDLVVEASGHMRGGFAGRAYLPQAVPAGVALGDLR
jgi:hypothetical protein